MPGMIYNFYNDQIQPEEGHKGVHVILSPPRVLYVGHYFDECALAGNRHAHDFCEVSYISEGCCLFECDGEIYRVKKGDVVVVHPGVRHVEKNDDRQPVQMVYFGVSNIQVSGYPSNRLLEPGKPPILDTRPYAAKMESLFADLLIESGNGIVGSYDYLQSLVVSILVMLMRINHISTIPQEKSMADSIQDFLNKNYTSVVSLEDVAKHFFISKDYASHIFKEHTGSPLITYVIQKRMEKAEELLASTNKPIVEIALEMGYNDPNYFSFTFKKYHNMTPRQYRSRYRSEEE